MATLYQVAASVVLAGVVGSAILSAQPGPGTKASTTSKPTAREIIERIKAKTGLIWNDRTVDTIKAGDPETRITGIATTMMATHDVLQRAAAEGKNLIITHEPTFYSHLDGTDALQERNDRVWRDKDAFIRANNLVIFRFHDYWHQMRPDGVLLGMTKALGWEKMQDPKNPNLYTLPETTVERLAASIQQRLKIRVVRGVGSPDMKFTRIGFVPGASGPAAHFSMLERDDVEVLVIGEVPEWETIEYVGDASAQGKKKALILMGHVPSEQAGMEECAAWLKTFIHDVPVGFVPTAEPFWMPKAIPRAK